MTKVNNIVLVPGWGINSCVWLGLLELIGSLRPDLNVQLIDFPGYAQHADSVCPSDLNDLATFCLEQAPQDAVWVGWSLGGMVAMQAALTSGTSRVRGLQLIATSAKFVASPDWQFGVDVSVFERFCNELSNDYRQALKRFLLLQAGNRHEARGVVKELHQRIIATTSPTKASLQAGLSCLAGADLRGVVDQIDVPTQVVIGKLDRVANPAGGEALARSLGGELVALHCGHAPFITHAEDVVASLLRLLADVERAECND
ncbi:alpha/beta fold hydrolase [Arenicella xantha]|uniref:Carboxylesterase BioH (Pimeloyl-CoA synthesis) n=1 Tax=Arenicella xantha TaxID=644221 RepID=A0A395JU68_9GAMM|nr:alpha/beta fold hydrolase [Arenicella xantha]RBP53088.1 carboxylesterase BioH (pimeloyl-CoA synthesis) [Arenicella xantha]